MTREPLTRVPPPADDSPVARLAHVVGAVGSLRYPPSDDDMALPGTHGTGLTWGDLRALLADLTACGMCFGSPTCPGEAECGAELDQPETEETP